MSAQLLRKTDQELREIAQSMMNVATLNGLISLDPRTGGLGRRTLVVLNMAIPHKDDLRPFEVSAGSSLAGRGFDIIVIGDCNTYRMPEHEYNLWYRSVVRCRLDVGGIIVEVH